ncbi:iron-siderophore ABC transporter substrate-binding protein [Tsukamurella sp. 8F]|uniref:ABC transporter substrate-binding protein n=1 Tax=unclassified Tsukamurella TaxID=2633480 RepID=UPI0023B9E6D5|nr:MULTISPECIES: iron-siderophore ABC transporter substrate-binding protein [unclassified Tsukamurella]MDF0529564.1 iron-siderophore ABC transporter substrate-binding protein [Tsukamurella sp. 8J]MDF0585748.1 iron-siderophore ABC transporter substrate-binding protein [Tsukamurella sp. 8F]
MSLRSTLRVGLAATIIGLVAACGTSAPDPRPTSPSSTAGGFPRTVIDATGEVEIPAQPHRVAALDNSYAEAVLMLDTPLIAYTQYHNITDALPGYLGASAKNYGAHAVSVGPIASPDLEQLITLKPDLIVSAKVRHEKIHDKLAKIAPTVMSQTTGPTWKQNITLLAKALGKEQLAAERMHEYEAAAKQVGDAVKAKAGAGTTISVVRFLDGPTRLYALDSFSGNVLQDAGLARPKPQDVHEFTVEISEEQIAMADADKIFTTTYGDAGNAAKSAFARNPLWTPLAPKVVQVSDEEWMTSVSVQGAYRILADIARAFDVPAPKTPAWMA